MKKSIILLLLIGLLQSFSFIHFQKNDLEKSCLSGEIKSIRETSYSMSNNSESKGEENIISDNLTIYNPDGNKLKTSNYKNGALFSYIVYNYDQQGFITGSNEYNADGSMYLTISYSGDENGNITKAKYDRILQKTYDADRSSIDVEYDKYYQNLFTNISFENDFKGNILVEKYFSENGRQTFKILNKYDYKYNKVEVKYYNTSGNVSWRKKLKYDVEGNTNEVKLFESNRLALVSKFEYEFDQYDNWTNRIESRKLYDNFFADDLNDNTIISIRKIEYF